MEVIKNRIYKHFKGNYYLVLDIVINSETDEEMVVYQALYEDGKRYVRPISMFIDKVDKKKYPNCLQEYRFQLEEIESKNRKRGN